MKLLLRLFLTQTALVLAVPVFAQQYTVTVLPSATNETTVPVGTAINSNGTVTGVLAPNPGVLANVGVFTGFSPQQPGATGIFQFTPSKPNSPNGSTADLGSYDPVTMGSDYCTNTVSPSVAAAINASGQIVGAVCANTIYAGAFSYLGGFSLFGVPNLPAGLMASWATGINTSGQVVGTLEPYDANSNTTTFHTFLYSTGGGAPQDLGALDGVASFGGAINDSGQIAGTSEDAQGNLYAYVYDTNTATTTDLGNLGSQYAVSTAINAGGQVTGFSQTCCGTGPAAFMYTPLPPGSPPGTPPPVMQGLGNLGGTGGSQGSAINTAGLITGASYTAGNLAIHAFLYNGSMVDLNSLLSSCDAAQYTLVDGVAINDSGQIVVLGYENSNQTSGVTFLLTPGASTCPQITPHLTGPQGLNGWYVGAVQLSWTVDSTLPITSKTGCATHTFPANTKGTVRTCSATNAAGTNSGSVTIRIDTTAPVTTAKKPAANANGWHKAPVTVTFTGTDPTSGISACSGPVVLSSEGAAQSASGSCTNNAGLTGSASATGINIDLTPPAISLNTPANGATYALGSTVPADYTCADALSGVATCTGTVAAGSAIATGTKGAKVFTVTATDLAGNTTRTRYTYTVD